MNNPHGLQVFDTRPEACDFQGNHNCASCWDALINVPDGEGGYVCLCIRCEENTRGYVTRKYVERRIKYNEDEARLARQALRPYVKFLQITKRTESKNITDLGF